MERQCDHRLDRGQIDINHAVIVSSIGRIQLPVCIAAAVHFQELAGLFIGAPDGCQTGGLRRHDVNTVAVIGGHARHAGSDEFHNLVLNVAVFEHCTDDRQCDVLRADTGIRPSVQINADDAGVGHIIGVAQELLHQLAAALADCHRAECAVPGVGVGAQNHPAASGHRLTHILMDDRHVRRHVDAAVFAGRRQTEYMVVFVDRSADGTQAVVTVRQHVGNGELLHAGCAGGLDNADKGDVMGCQRIKFNLQLLHIAGGVVRLQNGIGDGALPGFFFIILCWCGCLGHDFCAVYKVDAAVIQLDHCLPPVGFYSSLWNSNGFTCRTTSITVPSRASMMPTTRSAN